MLELIVRGLGVVGVVLASLSWSQDHAAPGQTARTFAFVRTDALKDWTITGDVSIDSARTPELARLAPGRHGGQGAAEAPEALATHNCPG